PVAQALETADSEALGRLAVGRMDGVAPTAAARRQAMAALGARDLPSAAAHSWRTRAVDRLAAAQPPDALKAISGVPAPQMARVPAGRSEAVGWALTAASATLREHYADPAPRAAAPALVAEVERDGATSVSIARPLRHFATLARTEANDRIRLPAW